MELHEEQGAMKASLASLVEQFGGMKESGVGQVNGETGLKGYCFAQPILTARFGGRQTAERYPYSAKADEGLRRFARTLYGGPLGRWLS